MEETIRILLRIIDGGVKVLLIPDDGDVGIGIFMRSATPADDDVKYLG